MDGPDFDALVIRRGDERLSVAGEADAAHRSRMSSEHRRLAFPEHNTNHTLH